MRRFPPRRLLAAVDLSPCSRPALETAQALARRWGATLELACVQHPPVLAAWAGFDDMPAGVPHAFEEPRLKLEEKLRKAAAGFPAGRLKVRTLHGWPPVALGELAGPERADLMVMGTHGRSGIELLLAGSVAEAVLRRARVPVLIVPERAKVPAEPRVLAPWNARPYATRALRWARELARALGAPLDVLYVQEPGAPAAGSVSSRRWRLRALLGTGTGWVLRERRGDARAIVIAEANSGRYSHIVLSAHRRPFAADLALGSTVERLLRHGSAPVLAVPSGLSRPLLARGLAQRAGALLY